MQQSLFPQHHVIPNIPGLTLVRDYISVTEEQRLLSFVDRQAWSDALKRRVQHYGWRYDYRARTIDRSMHIGSLPTPIKTYSDAFLSAAYTNSYADQVIVNEYLPGQGIAQHVDCVPCFGKTILSLSLGSDCVMHFTSPETNQKHAVILPLRSLLILSEDARYRWKHGIPARKQDKCDGITFMRQRRVSLTFREVLL